MSRFALRGACAVAALCAGMASAAAASSEFTTAHTETAAGAVSVTMNGDIFTNHGLLGMGRVSASTIDFMGTTLGSFSGMAIDASTWRKVGDGYAGTLYSLPDRGYNAGTLYSDYQGRLVQFDLSLTPYSGPDLPADAASQSQIVLTPTGTGIALTDFNGVATTGLDPAAGTIVQDGHILPSPEGAGTRQVTLDAEAVAFLPDGSFYVGDEYTAGIYLFAADGHMIGFIAPPAALLPITDGEVNYNSTAVPDTGRRNNQGMEAVALTPDGKKLVAVLQSATIQDGAGNASNRGNTRILVYDLSESPTPANPVEHYVLQLPLVDDKGSGGAVNKTAAQSEVLAINDHQFLVLARDSAGYGTESATPEIFKSILLVDTAGATNLAGTDYETSATPVSTGKLLDPSITPVQSAELVNLLNTTQLAKFGMNIDTASPVGGTSLTLSEKWEAMALLPALDEANPQDFILFVANDNDFLTQSGVMPGYTYDAGLENDTMIMAFRLTLPTAIDPLFEMAMTTTGAAQMSLVDQALAAGALQGVGPVTTHLSVLRGDAMTGLGARTKAGEGRGARLWTSGLYAFGDIEDGDIGTDTETYAGTIGVDLAIGGGFTVGVAVGAHGGSDETDNGYRADHDGYSISAYGQYVVGGFSLSAAYGYVPMSLDKLWRPGAYGLTGTGETDATAHVFSTEAAYHLPLGGVVAGPVVSLARVAGEVDGYVETGAAGGNIVYPSRSFSQTNAGFGAEAILPLDGLSLTGRAIYNWVLDSEADAANLRLAGVAGSAGTAVDVPSSETETVTLGLRAQGAFDAVGWFVGYDLDIGMDGGLGNTITSGVSVGF